MTPPDAKDLNEMSDEALMRKCLDLARKGAGLVSPNPMVGSLVVSEGRVVGEGFHLYSLFKHAEGHALDMAGELARGATVYCSLEPCSHLGRTTPCAEALVEARIARAVIAVIDPDPRVHGKGIERMRSAGIQVDVGLLAEEAILLNEIYWKVKTTGRPFVHIIRADADPKAKPPDWIPSNSFIRMSREYDAIIINDQRPQSKYVVERCREVDRHRPLTVVEAPGEKNRSNIMGTVGKLAGEGATSVLLFALDSCDDSIESLEEFDKVTIVAGDQTAIAQRMSERYEAIARTAMEGDFFETTFRLHKLHTKGR